MNFYDKKPSLDGPLKCRAGGHKEIQSGLYAPLKKLQKLFRGFLTRLIHLILAPKPEIYFN